MIPGSLQLETNGILLISRCNNTMVGNAMKRYLGAFRSVMVALVEARCWIENPRFVLRVWIGWNPYTTSCGYTILDRAHTLPNKTNKPPIIRKGCGGARNGDEAVSFLCLFGHFICLLWTYLNTQRNDSLANLYLFLFSIYSLFSLFL